MQRIERVDEAEAPARSVELLAAVRKQMGRVPNLIATMAQSPAALGGYLGLATALAGGRLSRRLQEQIALAVAGANTCDYCASAHAALAGGLGLERAEIERNLVGRSADPAIEAALQLATRIIATRGKLTSEELTAARRAGIDDATIVEIVANTALNIFTNYLNHVAGTEIDFPLLSAGATAPA